MNDDCFSAYHFHRSIGPRGPCTGERRGNDQQCDQLLDRFGPDSYLGGGSQKAPSIGIQTAQRSNRYSKQVDQKIIY